MRIILILLFLLVNIVCNGQTSTAKVVLKSGVTITGIIKEMVINDHIKITVSGVDTTPSHGVALFRRSFKESIWRL